MKADLSAAKAGLLDANAAIASQGTAFQSKLAQQQVEFQRQLDLLTSTLSVCQANASLLSSRVSALEGNLSSFSTVSPSNNTNIQYALFSHRFHGQCKIPRLPKRKRQEHRRSQSGGPQGLYPSSRLKLLYLPCRSSLHFLSKLLFFSFERPLGFSGLVFCDS